MTSTSRTPVTLRINRHVAQAFKIVRPVSLSAYMDVDSSPEARRADQLVLACRENVRFLNHHLRRFERYLALPPMVDNILYLAYTITVKREAPFTADQLRRHLAEAGIETRTNVGFAAGPEDFLAKLGISNGGLDVDTFCLGCHRYVTILDLEHIIDTFESFFAGLGGESQYV
jgi:dTDP-4-amino-4,6-dideoxygalactose transaminase